MTNVLGWRSVESRSESIIISVILLIYKKMAFLITFSQYRLYV